MQLLFDSNGKNLLVTPHYHHKSVFLQLSFHTALKSVYTDSLTNEDSEGEIAAVTSLIYQELQGITWTFQGKFVQICWNFQGIYQVSEQVMAGTLICDKPEIKTKTYTRNQRQNELRHFALNWTFLRFTDFKRRKYSFFSPIPSMQCCADVPATYKRHPNFEWEGRGGHGRGVDSFVLLSYPIWVQCQLFCRRLWLLLHIKMLPSVHESKPWTRRKAACKESRVQ